MGRLNTATAPLLGYRMLAVAMGEPNAFAASLPEIIQLGAPRLSTSNGPNIDDIR